MQFQFSDFQDFLQMGGYAGFVWSAWGITLIAVIGLTISAVRAARFWQSEVEKFEVQMKLQKQADNEKP